jgi:hypothetical protein
LSATVFLEREFEEGTSDSLLEFFSMLGKAKVGISVSDLDPDPH